MITINGKKYQDSEAGIIPSLRCALYETPTIEKSNSSFGNYLIKISEVTFKFFMTKKQAEDFLSRHIAELTEEA